jgi:hypothetical protein
MDGRKFRRQHAIGRYIVDFVCLPERLIIEIDGDSHFMDDVRPELDAERTAYLQKLGFRVRRFGNHQVMTELESVTEAIFYELEGDGNADSSPSPQPSPRWGEGEPAPSPRWGEGEPAPSHRWGEGGSAA